MPHATTPGSSPPVEDTVMSEAPVAVLNDAANDATGTVEDQEDDVSAVQPPAKTSLEDMFDDDDEEDEEFSSSAQTRTADSSQEAKPTSNSSSKATDPEVMRVFYQRSFPFRYLFQWLNHSPTPTTDFSNREFAFVSPNDAYIRYQSFVSADQLRKQCVQLTPTRFEIGPEYSTNPRDRKTLRKASAFRPVAKESVFDIDMTDYDEIRTCCSGASICQKCWTFITMAIKVVDAASREDFGFKHISWVYSGRRGAHAWISDKRARQMDDQKRKSIAGYSESSKGGDKGGKKVNVKRPSHPHLERSLNISNPHFQADVLIDQDPWAEPAKSERSLQLLGDKTSTAALQKKWDASPHRSSAQKWSDIDTSASAGSLSTSTPKTSVEVKQDIRSEYTYPRSDAEVSKKSNHLLKSPFVVHPGTGRVCVPIDVRRVEDFEPESVPTIQQSSKEIDAYEGDGREDEAGEKMQDWEKTSLKPYVEYFRTHVNTLMKDEMGAKRARAEEGESMDF